MAEPIDYDNRIPEEKQLINEMVKFTLSEEREQRIDKREDAPSQGAEERHKHELQQKYATKEGLNEAQKHHDEQSHKLDGYDSDPGPEGDKKRNNIDNLVRHEMTAYKEGISNANYQREVNHQKPLDMPSADDYARHADDLRAKYASPQHYDEAAKFTQAPGNTTPQIAEGKPLAAPATKDYSRLPESERKTLDAYMAENWQKEHDASVKALQSHGKTELEARTQVADNSGKAFHAYQANHKDQSLEQAVTGFEVESKQKFIESGQTALAKDFSTRQNVLKTYEVPVQQSALAVKPAQEEKPQQAAGKDSSEINGLLYKMEVNEFRAGADASGFSHMNVGGMAAAKKNGYKVWDPMTTADNEKLAALLKKDIEQNGGKEFAKLSGGEKVEVARLTGSDAIQPKNTAVASAAKTGGHDGPG